MLSIADSSCFFDVSTFGVRFKTRGGDPAPWDRSFPQPAFFGHGRKPFLLNNLRLDLNRAVEITAARL